MLEKFSAFWRTLDAYRGAFTRAGRVRPLGLPMGCGILRWVLFASIHGYPRVAFSSKYKCER